MTLSGKVWPVHIKPQEDELLSSWMIRLAHANGIKVMTLCTKLFGYRRPVWNRDIDRLAPPELIEKLGRITGTSYERLYSATLREFEGKVFEKLNLNGNSRWILPLGIYHRSRKDYGIQYCPQCLSEDLSPYFRRAWRVGFITVCTRHERMLLDRCQDCGAPIAPHRVDMKSRSSYPTERNIIECASCGSSLAGIPVSGHVDERVIYWQRQWEQAMNDGWISWADNSSMYSFLFFNGLRALCAGLVARKDRGRLTCSLRNLSKIGDSWSGNGIEYASTQVRHTLLTEVVKLLECWPEKFLVAARESSLRYSTLRGYGRDVPYWYESVIKRELSHIAAPITKDEAEAIVNAIEHKYGRFSNRLARKLYGVDISDATRRYVNPPVSDDDYEMLLASLDHEIAGTQDQKVRLELLRDKVMFTVGRALKLSIEKLSKLTIEDVRTVVPKVVQLQFYQAPQSAEQGRAWCEWYLVKVRPQLEPMPIEQRLFISLKIHVGLGVSAIGCRFKRAVTAANLHREIKGYTNFISNA